MPNVRKVEHIPEYRRVDRKEALVDLEEVRVRHQNDISVGKPEEIVCSWAIRGLSVMWVDVHGQRDGG